jgi:hypothetical protein
MRTRIWSVEQRHCERGEAIHAATKRKNGLLRGACHRARIRATRWLAMTVLHERVTFSVVITRESG